MEARDSRPDRPRVAGAGSAGRQAPAARGAAAGAVRPLARPSGLPASGLPAPGQIGLRPAQHPLPVNARRDQPGQSRYSPMPAPRTGFGLPSLRRNVCPHFYMTGSRGAIPIQAPHLLKALIRQEMNISRCQLRGGVHLEQGYVNDVCLTPRFNQCVFYEDDLTKD
jgi:hypothetical protein